MHSKIIAIRTALNEKFLERSNVIDGLLSAVLAKQHILLLGPPGTAKTALAQEFSNCIDGASYFQWLLTKFSTPEELFGPISLAGLKNDRVRRITDGKMPEASFAMLDEIFKANSAILNSILTLINERKFHNDGIAVDCPLVSVIGASNELPEGEELEALFDRFLVRYWISYLDDPSNVRNVLSHSTTRVAVPSITVAELEAASDEVAKMDVPDSIFDAILLIKQRSEDAGFRSSDRRWKQAMGLLKAHSWLNGDQEVTEDSLELLADVMWREPKDRAQLASIIGTVGNPLNIRATENLDAAVEIVDEVGVLVNPNDADDKAEWMKKASLADTRLTQIIGDLEEMVTKNPKRNLRRVRSVINKVTKMKADIAKKVTDAYGI